MNQVVILTDVDVCLTRVFAGLQRYACEGFHSLLYGTATADADRLLNGPATADVNAIGYAKRQSVLQGRYAVCRAQAS